MSRHHRDQHWSTHAPRLRELIEAQLPLPCMDGCGATITRDLPRSAWQVGHRRDAAKGGGPTTSNTGPILTRCNLRSGGRAGAKITNGRRDWHGKRIREW